MGDSAPYVAVINLALMTAHHWRTLRLKLIQNGVPNPMALPTAHVLLDLTEHVLLESMQSDKPEDDAARRTEFMDALYRPIVKKRSELPSGWREPPPGFEDDDANAAASDAAMAMISRRR